MTQSEINPHAKQRFQSIPGQIDAHHEMLASVPFQRAEDMAMMYYTRALAGNIAKSQNQQQEAMINGLKMLGVQEFLAEFRALGEKSIEVIPPGRARTLNHNQ